MNRYRITLLVPHATEVLAVNQQAAHLEATRLAHTGKTQDGQADAIVHSVEFLNKEADVVDFNFDSSA
jgi:hypothetical protein